MIKELRVRLFHILHKPKRADLTARYFNYFLFGLILLNAIAAGLETVASINAQFEFALNKFEFFSTLFFTVEYLMRLWVVIERPGFRNPVLGRLKYLVQPLTLVDLAVILTYFTTYDLRFLRLLRVVGLLPVLHLENYEETLAILWLNLLKRRQMLILSMTLMLVVIYCGAAVLYQIEHTAQPQVFTSIPATLWWALVTFTTTGYGDVVPISDLGKFATGVMLLFGIGIFALPAAIVTAAVLEVQLDSTSQYRGTCPHCGKPLQRRERSERDREQVRERVHAARVEAITQVKSAARPGKPAKDGGRGKSR